MKVVIAIQSSDKPVCSLAITPGLSAPAASVAGALLQQSAVSPPSLPSPSAPFPRGAFGALLITDGTAGRDARWVGVK